MEKARYKLVKIKIQTLNHPINDLYNHDIIHYWQNINNEMIEHFEFRVFVRPPKENATFFLSTDQQVNPNADNEEEKKNLTLNNKN